MTWIDNDGFETSAKWCWFFTFTFPAHLVGSWPRSPPFRKSITFLHQTGNATAEFSTDVDMNVVAGQVPFEFIVEDLEQDSSEPAGFNMRVSAMNSAGYGRPSVTFNIKVEY